MMKKKMIKLCNFLIGIQDKQKKRKTMSRMMETNLIALFSHIDYDNKHLHYADIKKKYDFLNGWK